MKFALEHLPTAALRRETPPTLSSLQLPRFSVSAMSHTAIASDMHLPRSLLLQQGTAGSCLPIIKEKISAAMCLDAWKLAASKNPGALGSFSSLGLFTVKKIGLCRLREIKTVSPFLNLISLFPF